MVLHPLVFTRCPSAGTRINALIIKSLYFHRLGHRLYRLFALNLTQTNNCTVYLYLKGKVLYAISGGISRIWAVARQLQSGSFLSAALGKCNGLLIFIIFGDILGAFHSLVCACGVWTGIKDKKSSLPFVCVYFLPYSLKAGVHERFLSFRKAKLAF